MSESYYGRPIVKAHVWKWYVPLYFWVGGVAGAASVQCFAARLQRNDALATVHKRIALVALLIAPPLLIADLGVPKRFPLMLRVFKPTSPMNAGSWILTAFGGALVASFAADALKARPLAMVFEALAALAGPALASYTAVLLADTATPAWHEARGMLPFVFVASALSASGAVATAFAPPHSAAPARSSMIGGALAMVLATQRMEAQLGPLLATPYRRGTAGRLAQLTRALAIGGAVTGAFAGRSVTRNRIAAALVVAAGVCERFAVFAAGTASATDPRYTVEPQHARLAERAANAAASNAPPPPSSP